MAGESAAPAPTGPPAATPPPASPPPNTAPAGSPPSAADWMAELSPEDRGHYQNKQYGSVKDLSKAYRNAEALIQKVGGAPPERVIVLPADDADGSARKAALSKFGVPATPGEYGFAPTDPKADATLATKAGELAHKYSLPLKEARGFVSELAAVVEGMAKANQATSVAAQKAAADGQTAKLRAEWGDAYDGRVALCKSAVAKMIPETFNGASRTAVLTALESVLGADGMVKLVHSWTEMFGEGRFIQGTLEAGGTREKTPDAKAAAWRELMKTPGYGERLAKGDPEALRQRAAIFNPSAPQTR